MTAPKRNPERMSKYVDEVIRRTKEHPEAFMPVASTLHQRAGTGAKMNNGIRHRTAPIWVGGGGSEMVIGDIEIPVTLWDSIRLECAVKWWYRNADLKYILS